MSKSRTVIGIWTEWPRGAGWTNEGMTRLLGFLIEGAARTREYFVKVFVARHILDEASQDLARLRATSGDDYGLCTVSNFVGNDAEEIDALIELANAASVEGWIVLYPNMFNAERLLAPRAVVFPDANPIQFPNFGDNAWAARGEHSLWRDKVARMLRSADRVITFSNHVANNDAQQYFGVVPHKIRVVPHAPPNLAHLLDFVVGGRKTFDTIRQSAEILRAHCAERHWSNLASFPFEEVKFFVVSTQDRPTKNLSVCAQATELIIRNHNDDLKMITTAHIHHGAEWTRFPEAIQKLKLQNDIISIPNLPRTAHAALYHCASCAVHPSIFEGGHGPFPFYEAVSVGTPCLMARGPHTLELLEYAPELAPYMFDPFDSASLAKLLIDTGEAPDAAIDLQRATLNRLMAHRWEDVAAGYAKAALEGTKIYS